jgi:hypothetical protein
MHIREKAALAGAMIGAACVAQAEAAMNVEATGPNRGTRAASMS